MKATRHNGRSGKHGTYDAKHNDRRFDVENSEHIDAERTKFNVYWDRYQGYSTITLIAVPIDIEFRPLCVNMLTVLNIKSTVIMFGIISPMLSRPSIMSCCFHSTLPSCLFFYKKRPSKSLYSVC